MSVSKWIKFIFCCYIFTVGIYDISFIYVFLLHECLMVLYFYVLQIVDLFITDDKPSYYGFNAIKVSFVLYCFHSGFFFYQWDFFYLLMVFRFTLYDWRTIWLLVLTEGKHVLLYTYPNIPNPAMVLTRTSELFMLTCCKLGIH